MTPADLEQSLLSNGLTARRFQVDAGRPNHYRLALPHGGYSGLSFATGVGVAGAQDYLRSCDSVSVPVTFHREAWDQSDDADLVFLTYGSPELAALLPAPAVDGE